MRVAIVGAGRVGSAIARAAVSAGIEVSVSASGPKEDIALLVQHMAPGAVAETTEHAATDADVVVLAIPLPKYRSLDAHLLSGRVVIDAMNFWPPTDGALPEFLDPSVSSSEVIAAHLVGARVVKTLNHIGYHEIDTEAAPARTPGRRALALASDDTDAAQVAATLLDRLGYDPLDAGPLERGRLFQPGTKIFNEPMTVDQLRDVLDRYAGEPPAA